MTLTQETITFGKYKNQKLSALLRDRKYTAWLCGEIWFRESYSYLYSVLSNHNPSIDFFTSPDPSMNGFLYTFKYFNLVKPDDLKVELSSVDMDCYKYYYDMIQSFRDNILERLENDEEHPYDIRVPSKWLNEFESLYAIPRSSFKEFLEAYDLINIPYIIEEIKKESGIDYKGARSWILAKEKSLEQEKWWSNVLKDVYKTSLGTQFKFNNCIFDFIVINQGIVFECKLSLKDFNERQHVKYETCLKEYHIVYLIDNDCIISMRNCEIYTTDSEKYSNYIFETIKSLKEPSYLDVLIRDFDIIEISSIENGISRI